MIRCATVKDVATIGQIVNDCAEYGQMLHRSLEFLYEHVRDFYVAIEADQVIGVCGLRVVWGDLAEVYALAVSPGHRGKGLGKLLVKQAVSGAVELGIARLMTLTYEQAFFSKIGFEILDRQALPLKVWAECVRCSKNQACDEIAMERVLEGASPLPPPQPTVLPDEPYIVPVTLKVVRAPGRQKMDEAP